MTKTRLNLGSVLYKACELRLNVNPVVTLHLPTSVCFKFVRYLRFVFKVTVKLTSFMTIFWCFFVWVAAVSKIARLLASVIETWNAWLGKILYRVRKVLEANAADFTLNFQLVCTAHMATFKQKIYVYRSLNFLCTAFITTFASIMVFILEISASRQISSTFKVQPLFLSLIFIQPQENIFNMSFCHI